MKKILENQVLEISFETVEGGSETLRYELYDHSVTRRWMELLAIDMSQAGALENLDVAFYSHSPERCERAKRDLKNILVELDRIDQRIFTYYLDRDLTEIDLIEIHTLKEGLTRLGLTEGFIFPAHYWRLLTRMNRAIHEIEFSGKMAGDDASMIIVPSNATRVPLKREELNLFQTDFIGGELYLDYGTNGVPYLDAFIEKSGVSPVAQSDITSGIALSFFNEARELYLEDFKNWLWEVHGKEFKDPSLALGHIPLGRLKVPRFDEVRAKFNRFIGIKDININSDGVEEWDVLVPKLALARVSKSFCPTKWKHATINFSSASVRSCCHLEFRKMDLHQVQSGNALHDTREDQIEREMMLNGERPKNCAGCWWLEDHGKKSDRMVWASKDWLEGSVDEIIENPTEKALDPTWLELNFSSACQLKCSYCSPIYSTKWQQEIQKFGPYPTYPGHNDTAHLSGLSEEGDPEDNEVFRAFWPWFERISGGLRLLKISGGEPLLSPSTFRVMEHLANAPLKKLTLSINSNLSVPRETFNRFVQLVNGLESRFAMNQLYIHPSIDSWGPQAEYIRFGLNLDLFRSNLEQYLSQTNASVILACTLNNLSLGSLGALYRYLLQIKRTYGGFDRNIGITVEVLHSPNWQCISILPPSFKVYLEEVLGFVRENRSDNGDGFTQDEVISLEKALAVMSRPMPSNDLSLARANFYRFFREHDRRRNTQFLETFPELAQFYRACGDLADERAPELHP